MIRIAGMDGVAVLTIDNPPVNATAQAVRQGLLDAITAAIADTAVAGIVIIGANDRFSAGGDVRELGNTALNQPSLRDSIALIERSPKPVVAALTGVALGGGLELALGCHVRVGADPLKLGLPEVTLGVIPGAGGTQRLPRLIGARAALDLATSGRHCSAQEAFELGLLDALASGPETLLDTALRQLRDLEGVSARKTHAHEHADAEWFERYRQQKLVAWEGQLAPWLIVDAIEQACLGSESEGYACERQAYVRCQTSPQRAALGYLFAARRRTAKQGLGERAQNIADGLSERFDAETERLTREQLRRWPVQAGTELDACVRALSNVGERLIASGVALDAQEIDVIAVDGLGFPAHFGGPMYQAQRQSERDRAGEPSLS